MRDARGGGAPLLSRLRETDGYGSKLGLHGCCALGELFPELRELTIGTFCLTGPSPYLPALPLCLPNLRILHVRGMCNRFDFSGASPHLSSAALRSVLGLLVTQCPRLEALCLGHGAM